MLKNLQIMEIEINGIKYKQIERQPKKKLSRKAAGILLMAEAISAFDSYPYPSKPKKSEIPAVDIVKEYEYFYVNSNENIFNKILLKNMN
jgi:hypothetical protein